METYMYDASFLCLRIDPSGGQKVAVQSRQQPRKKQKTNPSTPATFHGHQWKTQAPTPPTQRTPPRYKLAIITWLAIFPLITIVLALFGSLLMQLPLVMRTFVLTVILVPVMTYLIVPLYLRLFARWLSRGASEGGAIAQEVPQGATHCGLPMNSLIRGRRFSSPCQQR